MSNQKNLTPEQMKMIEDTLRRIQAGLRKFSPQLPEPTFVTTVEA